MVDYFEYMKIPPIKHVKYVACKHSVESKLGGCNCVNLAFEKARIRIM